MVKKILLFLLIFAVLLTAVILIAGNLFAFTPPPQEEITESVAEMPAQSDAPESFGEVTPDPDDPLAPERTPAPEEVLPDPDDPLAPERTPAPEVPEGIPSTPEEMLLTMSLEEKLCQMLFVTPEALTDSGTVTTADKALMEGLRKWPVGGIILFGDNLVSRDQTVALTESLQDISLELSDRKLFIGVDEEGGTVARAGDKLDTTKYEDMAVYGEAGDPAKAYEIGTTLAKDLLPLGFNVDFAPVADVLTNEENTVVSRRSFGSDPEVVSEMVSELIRGLEENNMLSAAKHFPGHGSTGDDTHDGFAATDVTESDLKDIHLKPFEAAIKADVPMIMVGHMTLTEIDKEYPATLSKKIVTGMLREELGYEGIIITDAMNMGAIANNYTVAESTVMAVEAGCDMLLCVGNVETAVTALLEAVDSGKLTESRIDESVLRILAAKYEYGIIE